MKNLLMALVCAFWPTWAHAQSVDCYDPETVATLGQRGLNTCAFVRFSDADAEMDRLFSQITDGQQMDDLRAAQQAWLTFRELACAAETNGFEDGSMFAMVLMRCQERLTQRRIEDLNQFQALR